MKINEPKIDPVFLELLAQMRTIRLPVAHRQSIMFALYWFLGQSTHCLDWVDCLVTLDIMAGFVPLIEISK